jgi:putative addiction module component (TIGR02574 family)
MNSTSVYLAEEALSLPAGQRAELAKLLITSLEGDHRSNAEIRTELERRLTALKESRDAGMSFEDVFGEPA